VLLGVAAVLVFLAGTQLFVFTDRTAQFFAWTVANPLAAAFLGASYWSALVIEVLAAREALWANARIAGPAVFVFTALTLLVTLVHTGQFHYGPAFAWYTRGIAYGWLVIYALVPVLLAVALIGQWRTPGVDPPRDHPMPAWLLGLAAAQAVVLLGVGLTLLVDSASGKHIWPWTLTALTAQATGAWLVGLGAAAAHAVLERDLRRVRPAAWGYVVFVVLQAVALARFPDRMHWSSGPGVVYVVVLVSMAVTGAVALLGSRPPASNP
jgi:hypothetical protein